MKPLKIGACLTLPELPEHKDWIFDDGRDLELQDFIQHKSLTSDFDALVSAARTALDGFEGRLGIHGPYEGLDLDNKDPEVRPIISARIMNGLEAAISIGATQMVLHSPFTAWYQTNLHNWKNYTQDKLNRVHDILDPVVERAQNQGVQIVIENVQDVDPASRRKLVDSFPKDALAVSIDTGHAHLTHHMSRAPAVDYFVRDAGEQLAHVHIQDLDDQGDRHWAPGEGQIHWVEVFRALAETESAPHLVLELNRHSDIPKGFEYLKNLDLVF